jgi:hypothetical protein
MDNKKIGVPTPQTQPVSHQEIMRAIRSCFLATSELTRLRVEDKGRVKEEKHQIRCYKLLFNLLFNRYPASEEMYYMTGGFTPACIKCHKDIPPNTNGTRCNICSCEKRTSMILHEKSHVDHVHPEVLAWVMHRFRDRNAFFMETVEIPEDLPQIECGLYGPVMGDDPVGEGEVFYGARGGRSWVSRLVDRLPRPTGQLTVIGGPHEGHPCVLYTTFGGPPTPKEPGDPSLSSEKRGESESFWSIHALSVQGKV